MLSAALFFKSYLTNFSNTQYFEILKTSLNLLHVIHACNVKKGGREQCWHDSVCHLYHHFLLARQFFSFPSGLQLLQPNLCWLDTKQAALVMPNDNGCAAIMTINHWAVQWWAARTSEFATDMFVWVTRGWSGLILLLAPASLTAVDVAFRSVGIQPANTTGTPTKFVSAHTGCNWL